MDRSTLPPSYHGDVARALMSSEAQDTFEKSLRVLAGQGSVAEPIRDIPAGRQEIAEATTAYLDAVAAASGASPIFRNGQFIAAVADLLVVIDRYWRSELGRCPELLRASWLLRSAVPGLEDWPADDTDQDATFEIGQMAREMFGDLTEEEVVRVREAVKLALPGRFPAEDSANPADSANLA